MPLETAVRLLSEMAGLKPVRVGNALFVTKKEVAAELGADPDLNPPAPVRSIDQNSRLRLFVPVWPARPGAIQAPAFTSGVWNYYLSTDW